MTIHGWKQYINPQKLVATVSRREGVYNRTGDLSVTCFGKEERRREWGMDFLIKKAVTNDTKSVTTWSRWQDLTRQALSVFSFICPFCSAKHGLCRFKSCRNFTAKLKDRQWRSFNFGRDDRTWTCGLCVPNAALYQTEPRIDIGTTKIVPNYIIILFFVCLG